MFGIGPLIALFTGKSGKWMWGLIGVLVITSAIAIAILTYKNVKKDNALLKTQNAQLAQTVKDREHRIEIMSQDQQIYIDRTNQIADQVTVLQTKMSKNSVHRQSDVDNIVTRPGTNATIEQVAVKANAGMNALFHDLQAMSREGLDDEQKN